MNAIGLSGYLLAVIGGVGATHEVLIWPAVQVRVLSAEESVSGVARPALTLVHGVAEVAQVDALCVLVAVVGLVFAWVLWLTHLLGGRSGEVVKILSVLVAEPKGSGFDSRYLRSTCYWSI